MKRLFVLLLCMLLQITSLHAENAKSLNLVSEKFPSYSIPRTQVIPLKDTSNAKQYELYLKLPENYHTESDKRYPVIYFTDAAWHIEILSAATEFLLQDVILVGISWQQDVDAALSEKYGEHVSRFSDYSYWQESNPNHPKIKFGGADKHLAFISKDVIPFIEDQYRTESNRRVYFGYSLGGGFGTHVLLNAPNTFTHYLLGSPSVKEFANKPLSNTYDNHMHHVFIAHGDLEVDRGEDIKAFVERFDKALQKQQVINYQVIAGDHATAFPETAIASVRWLASVMVSKN